MKQSFVDVALECVLDLGVTVLYAVIVGLAIVAIVASDQGPVSLVKAALYAGLLPGSVVVLICFDMILRFVGEGRSQHEGMAVKIPTRPTSRG